EMIERMWAHTKTEEAAKTEARIAAKYRRMRAAMEDLEKNHPSLFEGTGAVEKSAIDAGEIFPRRMKVPTETPP
ncbi:hypothetical protein BC830DRAFT_1050290, partial [Chytriomyces sp. MP71]